MRIGRIASTLAVLFALACSPARERSGRQVDCRPFPEGAPLVCQADGNGVIQLAPASIPQLSFDGDGLSAILVDKRDLYFVSRQGRTAPAFVYDNGPDTVVEGLARTTKSGRIGFVNPLLEVVVEPVWDFAFPFQQGVAVVCMGCTPTAGPGEEHRTVTGGKWGYIDKRGKVVVPVEHESQKLPSVETAAKQAAPR